MTVSPIYPTTIVVTQPAQLYAAVQTMMREPAIALDTESNSMHRYPEQLCLVQVADRYHVYIIDTIALKDLEPLKGILADKSIVKVVHGADYDLRCLDRHYGFRVHNLYDTAIAAQFAGMSQIGLAAVIQELLGVTFSKNKRLQRADWGRRPLSAEALDYAAADVRYSLALRETLNQRIQVLGRPEWVAEECARLEEVRYTAPSLETAFLSVKGSRELDPRGLAILKRLWLFREEEAQRQRRPPYYVLPDPVLIFLADTPDADLSQVPGLGQANLQRFGGGLQKALREGLAAPPSHRPVPAERVISPQQIERLRHLKMWRASLGTSLFLGPSMLWPTASLERLAKAPGTLEVELASPDIRRWQCDHFAPLLRTHLESLP